MTLKDLIAERLKVAEKEREAEEVRRKIRSMKLLLSIPGCHPHLIKEHRKFLSENGMGDKANLLTDEQVLESFSRTLAGLEEIFERMNK